MVYTQHINYKRHSTELNNELKKIKLSFEITGPLPFGRNHDTYFSFNIFTYVILVFL